MIEYAVQATGKFAGKLAELLKQRIEKNKMKARIKATGEIIDVVQDFTPNGVCLREVLFTESGIYGHRTFVPEELEFIPETEKKEIDWEERRYEIAKDLFVNNSELLAEDAVACADELITALKKSRKQ